MFQLPPVPAQAASCGPHSRSRGNSTVSPRVRDGAAPPATPRTLRQVRGAILVLNARIGRRDADHVPLGAASAKERAIAHR